MLHDVPRSAPLAPVVEVCSRASGAVTEAISHSADMHSADMHSPDMHRQITSIQLFAGAAEVRIDHHGVVYRLKQTSLGKLILTK
jgi:hemin uptake protein HemP